VRKEEESAEKLVETLLLVSLDLSSYLTTLSLSVIIRMYIIRYLTILALIIRILIMNIPLLEVSGA
jgi:hypothetical protein